MLSSEALPTLSVETGLELTSLRTTQFRRAIYLVAKGTHARWHRSDRTLQCSTSRNTLAMIRQSGEQLEIIEYLKTPPTRDRLIELLSAIRPRDLLRRKGTPYDELGLNDPKWTDDANHARRHYHLRQDRIQGGYNGDSTDRRWADAGHLAEDEAKRGRGRRQTAKLVILDRVMPERIVPNPVIQANVLLDLRMLVGTRGGLERTAGEFGALLRATNLRLERILPTRMPASLVEASPDMMAAGLSTKR